MSRAERDKWDDRYRAGSYEGRTHPSALVAEWAPRLPIGRALDVACGIGRNALHLAAAGFDVDAIDISPVGLERARRAAAPLKLEVRWLEIDFDGDLKTALPATQYALIVWIRYVNRRLMPHVVEHLRPGGHLICEQHLAAGPDVVGPKSPEFRLQPGELLRSAPDLQVLLYEEGRVVDPDGRDAALAQLVARRPD